MTIRAAVEADLPELQDIENDAGELFAEIGMLDIAEDEPPSLARLREFADAGRAWVWVDEDDRPVGYLVLGIVDGSAHVEQVSVRRAFAGRRIGVRLIEYAARWAVGRGMLDMTLTTFSAVPWNGPYYERLGFRVIPVAVLTPELRAIRAAEIDAGLDCAPRVAMRAALADLIGPVAG
ncbi:GNAT family N-acetyltransferase [Nocardia bovistercoris]|uniref:GNAT family N-acetyltransferase n=1 Tax=Nocardia bovistercoris TaxID=2785916 RepID=A0A931N2Q1_9NOCA|nr:GNAT family N-acetyltransferase [Nocardia bovistercoris]MBH0777124.1 GNAT family N-acetyltransferase [Nocardia bovistercoris]